MQTEQTDLGNSLDNVLDDTSVLRFLTLNPDFFNSHAEVLPRLRIPHNTGAAVSLIEKQVSVLRGKCTTLENSLRDLISVARDNEQLHRRLHSLVQDIISASTLDNVIALTRDSLLRNFSADDVRVLLVAPVDSSEDSPTEYFALQEDDAILTVFADTLAERETFCGTLAKKQIDALYGDDEQGDVASAAVVPLVHDGILGLIVLSSKDEMRFASGKGVMFLNQLGEVLSRRVRALV